MSTENKCPVSGGDHGHTSVLARVNRDWWPNQLNLHVLHQNSPLPNPMGKAFNYAKEFASLDPIGGAAAAQNQRCERDEYRYGSACHA